MVTRKRPLGHLNAVMDQQEGDGSGWAALLLHVALTTKRSSFAVGASSRNIDPDMPPTTRAHGVALLVQFAWAVQRTVTSV